MWKCQICQKEMKDDDMGIELSFGYVDSTFDTDPHEAFFTEEEIGPVCDDCAIKYIKGEIA